MKNQNEMTDYVDMLFYEEEKKSKELHKAFDEMVKKSQIHQNRYKEILLHESFEIRVNNSRYVRKVISDIQFDEFSKLINGKGTGNVFFGYNDKASILIWLRNDRDLNCCLREHFASNNSELNIVSFNKKKLGELAKINFSNEYCDIENSIHFKITSKDKECAVFLSLPNKVTKDEGFEVFKKILPKHNTISFFDSDGDKIQILSDIEWGYFLKECNVLYTFGKYPMLIFE